MAIINLLQLIPWKRVSQLLTINLILNMSFTIVYDSIQYIPDSVFTTFCTLWQMCFYSFGFVALTVPIEGVIYLMLINDSANSLISLYRTICLVNFESSYIWSIFIVYDFVSWCLHLLSLLGYILGGLPDSNIPMEDVTQEVIETVDVDELLLYKLKDPNEPPPYAYLQVTIDEVGPCNRE